MEVLLTADLPGERSTNCYHRPGVRRTTKRTIHHSADKTKCNVFLVPQQVQPTHARRCTETTRTRQMYKKRPDKAERGWLRLKPVTSWNKLRTKNTKHLKRPSPRAFNRASSARLMNVKQSYLPPRLPPKKTKIRKR